MGYAVLLVMSVMKDLIGHRFDRLTVIGYAGKIRGCKYWDVVCDCGTKKMIAESALIYHKTRSCGCLRDEFFMKIRSEGVKKGDKRGPYNTKHHTGIYAYLNKP